MVGINTNVSALNARSALDANSVSQSQAMQQLSTGLRINSAKDDAAGLAIATKMNSNIKGIAVAVKNANDGISMAQTAESSLGSVTNMLQRMRELAVQASNGTLTSANRASVQVEVTQLASEINNIGKTANFNGIKLFDGTAQSVTLQTNINSGDTVKMGIAQMGTSVLGVGTVPSVQGVVTRVTGVTNLSGGMTSNSLNMGDVVINGIMVGATKAADDTVSYDNNGAMNANNASSAIAKAAAINAISGQTGVKATVQQNIVSGVSMTAGTSGNTGTFTINGVTSQAVKLTGNTAADRVSTVNALNAISSATGVRAIDTQSNATGVQLIADDGRNIYAYGTYSSALSKGAAFGIDVDSSSSQAASATSQNVFIGGVSLQSTTSSPVTVSTTSTGNLTKAGLSAGTYAANSAIYATSGKQSVNGSSTSTYALTAGDLVISTKKGTANIAASLASDDTLSYANGAVTNATSAISISAAINKSTNVTGVTAVANANVIQGAGFSANATLSVDVVINGATVSFAAGDASSIDAVALKLNSVTGQSGVVASNNGSGITLTAADGRNISIGFGNAATTSMADLGLAASNMSAAMKQTLGDIKTGENAAGAAGSVNTYTFFSTVSLISSDVFTVSGGTNASTLSNLSALGFKEGTYGGSSNGLKISQIDLSTSSGASSALGAIDAALGQISDQRSNLGAIQNRLQSAVDNLTSSSTNLQSAQGRIQDTDYSATTTQMSKSQIISQAATAMLAQANQQPQMVLSLLK